MPDNVTDVVSGQAFLEFELQLPGSVVLPSSVAVVQESSRVWESVFGYGQSEIRFRTTTTAYVDRVLRALNAAGKPLIRFRWGLGAHSQKTWTPWQLHYVLHARSRFEGIGNAAGHRVVLQTRDLLHYVDRASQTRAHRGTISDILKKLASDNAITETVIEPTRGEGVWIQSFEGDFEFARTRLICRARSTQGQGNYHLYARDNALHFHTTGYQAVLHDLNYHASPGTRLEATDSSQVQLAAGSSGVRLTVHDPYSGISQEIASDPAQALRLGNSIHRLDKIAGAERNIREHRVQLRNEESGPTALAQNAYEMARAGCFQLKMQATGLAILRAGDLLRINVDPGASLASPWGGVYLIVSAQHTLVKNKITSVYIFQRGEQQVARGAGGGSPALQADEIAPGTPLNIPAIEASNQTRVSSTTAAGGNFLTVQQPGQALTPAPGSRGARD